MWTSPYSVSHPFSTLIIANRGRTRLLKYEINCCPNIQSGKTYFERMIEANTINRTISTGMWNKRVQSSYVFGVW